MKRRKCIKCGKVREVRPNWNICKLCNRKYQLEWHHKHIIVRREKDRARWYKKYGGWYKERVKLLRKNRYRTITGVIERDRERARYWNNQSTVSKEMGRIR